MTLDLGELMDDGFTLDTTRWLGHLWLARVSALLGVAALFLTRYFDNVRFVPVSLGFLLFALVCYWEYSRRLAEMSAVSRNPLPRS